MIKTASDAKGCIGDPHLPTAAPAEFSGTLDQFCSRYVLSNLPEPAVVADFHRQLTAYVRGPDPLLLIRRVNGTERRQEPYSTSDGTRFRATDNSPAWWTHAALLQGCRIAPGAFGDVVATMPIHFHFARKLSAKTANEAGWHVAHIFDVKDGNTTYQKWSHEDAIGRFVRNIHPCNYFLVAECNWQRWGGDRRVIAYFAELYAARYADVWKEFLTLALADASRLELPTSPVVYSYPGGQEREDTQKLAGHSGVGTCADCAAYESSRLLFRAAVIEALKPDEPLCIITPMGTFKMTKADIHRVFDNVVRSSAYRDRGYYHYPTVPQKALPFLLPTGGADAENTESSSPTLTERCVVYIDGYNFYYAIKKNPKETPISLGWCDFNALATRYFLLPGAQLTAVKYFTAPVGNFGERGGEAGGEAARQAIWLRAVRTILGLEVIEGFHTGDRSASSTSPRQTRTEKATDVNIAVSMVVDAARDEVDRILLVTADQDQLPAIRAVSGIFEKKVDVWLPPNHAASQWKFLNALNGVTVQPITREMLADSRLPERLEDADGVFEAPKVWRAPRGRG